MGDEIAVPATIAGNAGPSSAHGECTPSFGVLDLFAVKITQLDYILTVYG